MWYGRPVLPYPVLPYPLEEAVSFGPGCFGSVESTPARMLVSRSRFGPQSTLSPTPTLTVTLGALYGKFRAQKQTDRLGCAKSTIHNDYTLRPVPQLVVAKDTRTYWREKGPRDRDELGTRTER